jgi:hypothetical protein
MNKQTLSILALSLTLFVSSCRKLDVQAPEVAATAAAVPTAAAKWSSVTNWSASKQTDFTLHYGKIQDSTITASVASKGLVLVYQKTSGAVNSLPFEQTGASTKAWYYQVSEGTIMISCDAYGTDQKLANDESYAYFVLSQDKVKELTAQGFNTAELMNLSYEKASSLIK